MTTTAASAPGKVVLCGEYAVLEGAPAICMAIDKRARAEVSSSAADYHTVRARGYRAGEWRFSVRNDVSFEWLGDAPPEGSFDLLHQVWATMDIEGKFDVSMDTSEFLDPASKLKLGLGSSAALTVALATVLSSVTNKAGDTSMDAAQAHRRLQHGRGSGVDIAASRVGGLIQYRMLDEAVCEPLSWPKGLEYALLWSGVPASTSDKLARLDEERRSKEFVTSVSRLCTAAESAARCWSAGEAAALLDEFRRYVDALMQFDAVHDLGIFDAGHRELSEAAANRKLVYKPCGAGGGDSGMVFAADRDAIAEFVGFAGECGYRLLDVSLEARGVILER